METIVSNQIDGIIATNTTIVREGLRSKNANQSGGLSGQPLNTPALEVIKKIRKIAGDDFPIIGIGGIQNQEDAAAKIKAGANLIQIYTGLIYRGPGLVKEIIEN